MINIDKTIKEIIEDNLHSVKTGYKTSLEAFSFVIAFLLATNLCEAISDAEHDKYLDDFKNRLEVVENEKL